MGGNGRLVVGGKYVDGGKGLTVVGGGLVGKVNGTLGTGYV